MMVALLGSVRSSESVRIFSLPFLCGGEGESCFSFQFDEHDKGLQHSLKTQIIYVDSYFENVEKVLASKIIMALLGSRVENVKNKLKSRISGAQNYCFEAQPSTS